MIIYGENMNSYEVYYKDNLYIVDVIGKKNDLNIINITIRNNDYSFNLGNFYTALPYVIDDNYMFNFTKDLVNNIDKIIFECNRYIGDDNDKIAECVNESLTDKRLTEIYTEFIKMKNKTSEYIKYARFLELYFYSHNIPDGIRKVYLDKVNKSILDFKDVDDKIKLSFRCDISDLKNERCYKQNLYLIDELKKNLKIKEEELNILNNIISIVEGVLNKYKENDNINLNIESLENELKSINFFDKNRNMVKNKLRNLKGSVIEIDVNLEREKIYEEYKNYSLIYGDKHGMLLLFDKLEFSDILSLLENVFSSKKSIYLEVLSKINELKEEIDGYDDKAIDISDLYERLEVE